MSKIALCLLTCFALFAVASAGWLTSFLPKELKSYWTSDEPPPVLGLHDQCKEANKNFVGACSRIKYFPNIIEPVSVHCARKLTCAMKIPGSKSEVVQSPGRLPKNGTQCDEGKICSAGQCVEGIVPPQRGEHAKYTCLYR